jgi:hypothetical protein
MAQSLWNTGKMRLINEPYRLIAEFSYPPSVERSSTMSGGGGGTL